MSNVSEKKEHSRTSDEARSNDPNPSDSRSSLGRLADFTRKILRVSKNELESAKHGNKRLEDGVIQ